MRSGFGASGGGGKTAVCISLLFFFVAIWLRTKMSATVGWRTSALPPPPPVPFPQRAKRFQRAIRAKSQRVARVIDATVHGTLRPSQGMLVVTPRFLQQLPLRFSCRPHGRGSFFSIACLVEGNHIAHPTAFVDTRDVPGQTYPFVNELTEVQQNTHEGPRNTLFWVELDAESKEPQGLYDLHAAFKRRKGMKVRRSFLDKILVRQCDQGRRFQSVKQQGSGFDVQLDFALIFFVEAPNHPSVRHRYQLHSKTYAENGYLSETK